MIGIYAIRNRKNKKLYIGESLDIGIRWEEHINDLCNNIHHNHLLQKEWNEYGFESFSFNILEGYIVSSEINVNYYKTKLALICREYFYIKKYDTLKTGYNIQNTYNDILNGIYPSDLVNIKLDNGAILRTTVRKNDWLITDLCSKEKFISFVKDNTDKNDEWELKNALEAIKDDVTKKRSIKRLDFDYTDKNCFSLTKMISFLDNNFRDKYSVYVLYYVFMKMGYIIYVDDGFNNKWRATDLGVTKGYFITDNKPDKYKTLWTRKGIEYAKYISEHLSEFVNNDELCEAYSKKDGVAVIKLKIKDNLLYRNSTESEVNNNNYEST